MVDDMLWQTLFLELVFLEGFSSDCIFQKKILPYPTSVFLLEGSMAVILWEYLGK